MMVLDLCTELLGSIHPLGKVGRKDMKYILKEFSLTIDGAVFDLECLEANLLMRFLCVDVSSILACCEVATPSRMWKDAHRVPISLFPAARTAVNYWG